MRKDSLAFLLKRPWAVVLVLLLVLGMAFCPMVQATGCHQDQGPVGSHNGCQVSCGYASLFNPLNLSVFLSLLFLFALGSQGVPLAGYRFSFPKPPRSILVC